MNLTSSTSSDCLFSYCVPPYGDTGDAFQHKEAQLLRIPYRKGYVSTYNPKKTLTRHPKKQLYTKAVAQPRFET